MVKPVSILCGHYCIVILERYHIFQLIKGTFLLRCPLKLSWQEILFSLSGCLRAEQNVDVQFRHPDCDDDLEPNQSQCVLHFQVIYLNTCRSCSRSSGLKIALSWSVYQIHPHHHWHWIVGSIYCLCGCCNVCKVLNFI